MKRTNAKNDNKKINRGFSMVELVIVIAILAILIAVLAPSLMTYTERSRAQKDVTQMDEVVNAVQLAMADQDCYDEMIKYSCNNNFITYTDSSGNYGQVIADGEYWAPDGLGRATTITFNPEKDSQGNTIYRLENAIVNDMTYGNGSVAENRVMQGAKTDNQCYLKNASLNGSQTGYLYNRVRQSIGDNVITTSATYANSSFTIFIRFNQKDGVTVADVEGSFNGTNLSPDSSASKGSGTTSYDEETRKPIVNTNHESGKTQSNFTGSALQGNGSFYPEYDKEHTVPTNGTYITVDGNTYESGDPLPKDLITKDGDVYKDEYYEYAYNQYWSGSKWSTNTSQNGWGVRVLNSTLVQYGPIQNEINSLPVNTLRNTFKDCKSLKTAPTINEGVTSLYSTFSGCSSLTTVENIPKTVTSLDWTFQNCTRLIKAPNLSQCVQVKNLYNTFNGCSSLTDISEINIPEGVTTLRASFRGCALDNDDINNLILPDSVTDMNQTFAYCTRITDLSKFKFPSNIKSITRAFMGTNITSEGLPKIPSTVTGMSETFAYCKKLTNLDGLTIPGGVTSPQGAFLGCTGLKNINGLIISNGVKTLYETFNGCTSLIDASGLIIPSSVTWLSGTFKGCSSLQKAPIIPSTVTSMSNVFKDCPSLTG